MKLNFLLLAILSNSICFSQSARDYFFPASGKNVSVYVMKGASKGDRTTLAYYKDMGDSALITKVFPKDDGKIGWTEEIVKIEDSKIWLANVKSNVYNAQTYDADEAVLLTMPENGPNNQTESIQGSTKNSYSTEFLKIKINGKKRAAIKITKSWEMKRSGKKLGSYSDYYVKGIGYYKRTAEGTSIEILDEQRFDPNPPVLK